jgi:hypothetical protein
MRQPHSSRIPQKRQVSRSYPIPASTKGWVANEAITKMDPEAAVLLDNWFPTPTASGGAAARRSSPRSTPRRRPVETVMIWQGGSASRMFGCCNGKIYSDASAGGTITTTVATGLTNNRWQWIEFSTAGGQFLLACNGADAYRQYDGTTWTTTAVTGPAVPNALISIWAFKQRTLLRRAEHGRCLVCAREHHHRRPDEAAARLPASPRAARSSPARRGPTTPARGRRTTACSSRPRARR